MVARILQLLYKEIRGLHEAAYLLGAFALLSQILALVRDRLLAHNFGAGEILDLYYASFRIPDLIFVGIASLVSAYVLIPFISERLEDTLALREFIDSIFSFFFLLIIAVSAVVFLFAPQLTTLFFPGFSDTQLSIVTVLTQIMLLQPILLGISNLFASFTQTHHKFILYGVSPLLYNIGIITGILALYPIFGLAGLVYGVILGAFLHMAIQLPFIFSHGFTPRFTLRPNWAVVVSVATTSIPRTLALSVNQFALLALIAIGSLLIPGSISVFTFSFNLQAVPLAIIGASYSVAAFPTLARLFSEQAQDVFLQHVSSALRHIIFWSVPAVVFFVVLRAQFVRVILGSGAFDWADTRLTAAALALFIISLSAQAIVLLLVRGYYAAGKTWIPVVVNTISAALAVVLAYVGVGLMVQNESFRAFFESLFRVGDLSGTAVLMLPLSYSIGMIVNAILLLVLFNKQLGNITSRIGGTFWKETLASLTGGIAAYGVLTVLDDVFDLNTFIGIFLQGLIAGLVGLVVLITLLKFFKSRELNEVLRSFKKKFWKADVVFPGE